MTQLRALLALDGQLHHNQLTKLACCEQISQQHATKLLDSLQETWILANQSTNTPASKNCLLAPVAPGFVVEHSQRYSVCTQVVMYSNLQ